MKIVSSPVPFIREVTGLSLPNNVMEYITENVSHILTHVMNELIVK